MTGLLPNEEGTLSDGSRAGRSRRIELDALFLKGLVLYTQENCADAVSVWSTYFEVGEFDARASMVRQLYEDAKRKRFYPRSTMK